MAANQKYTATDKTIKKCQIQADQSKDWGSISTQRSSEKFNVDLLYGLEIQLKEIWSQYISYLDKNGFDETARALKNKYFRMYENYQKNKTWRNAMSVHLALLLFLN